MERLAQWQVSRYPDPRGDANKIPRREMVCNGIYYRRAPWRWTCPQNHKPDKADLSRVSVFARSTEGRAGRALCLCHGILSPGMADKDSSQFTVMPSPAGRTREGNPVPRFSCRHIPNLDGGGLVFQCPRSATRISRAPGVHLNIRCHLVVKFSDAVLSR